MHVVIAGGTGLIGSAIVPELLAAGHEVTVASRDPDRAAAQFEGKAKTCAPDGLPGSFDALVNVAGATIVKRWTEAYKRELRESRVDLTRDLRVQAEQRGAKIFIAGAAVGIYGDQGDRELTEDSPVGDDFLAQLAVDWEAAADSQVMRVVKIRIGLVMSKRGGILKKMLLPFKMGLGGRLSKGTQWMSWVHIDDIAAMFRWALEHENLRGVINGAAPNPVTNREFTKTLGSVLKRPTLFPVPKPALRLVLGEFGNEATRSQRVVPARPLKEGFVFKYPDLKAALTAAVHGD